MPRKDAAGRPHWTYANVVSTICMVLVVGGGTAIGARLLAGRDVRDGCLTGRGIKEHSIARRDLAKRALSAVPGAQGPAGAAGSQGAKGDKGDPGGPGTNGTNGTN